MTIPPQQGLWGTEGSLHGREHLCCGQVGCTLWGPILLVHPPLCSPSWDWGLICWKAESFTRRPMPAALARGGHSQRHAGSCRSRGTPCRHRCRGPGGGRRMFTARGPDGWGHGDNLAQCHPTGDLMQPAACSAGAESLLTPHSFCQRDPATERSRLAGIPLGRRCSVPNPCSTHWHLGAREPSPSWGLGLRAERAGSSKPRECRGGLWPGGTLVPW